MYEYSQVMIGIDRRVKLSVWAKRHGLTPRSARQMLSFGTLPAELDPVKIGRHWFVRELQGDRLRTVLYARVSLSEQRADLDRQKLRLLEHAQKHGMQVDDVIAEVGSGLNGSRRELLAALSRPGLGVLVVEHRDRLARFGFEMVDALLRSRGGGVVVVEEREVDADLVRDMTDVLTSLCARLYGRRSARRRAERAMAEAKR